MMKKKYSEIVDGNPFQFPELNGRCTDIKSKSKTNCKVIFAVFLLIVSQVQNQNRVYLATQNSTNNKDDANPKLSEGPLLEKAYGFLAPTDLLILENIYLEQEYMYYLTIEMGTPHACRAKINVRDPEEKVYEIFKANLTQYELHIIPFGTAILGGYRLEISTESANNFNLYIKLEQGLKCLYDKLSSEETENLVYYNVNKFYNGMYTEARMEFKSDWRYKACLARVSAISEAYSSEVFIDLTIEDPDDTEYHIYTHATLADIDLMTNFSFLTAISGVYTLKLTVYCSGSYVNLAYVVFDVYKLSQDIVVNDPDEEDNESDDLDLLTELGNITLLQNNLLLIMVVAVFATLVGIYILTSKLKKIEREDQNYKKFLE